MADLQHEESKTGRMGMLLPKLMEELSKHVTAYPRRKESG